MLGLYPIGSCTIGSEHSIDATGGTPSVVFDTIDVTSRVKSRALKQFSKSPVFQQTLSQLSAELQDLSETITKAMQSFTLDSAQGVQLDLIGKKVGQNRLIPYWFINPITWFTPDQVDAGPDQGAVWVTNGLNGDSYLMSDFEYRNMIKAKIYRNSCKFGSPDEIMTYAQMALGIPVSAQLTESGDIAITLPVNTPLWKVLWVKRFQTDHRGDAIPVMPYPVGMTVNSISYV